MDLPPRKAACLPLYSPVPLLCDEVPAVEPVVSDPAVGELELPVFEELLEPLLPLAALLVFVLFEELLEEFEELEVVELSAGAGFGPRESVIWTLEPFSREPEVGYWRMTEPAATVLEYSDVVRTTVNPADSISCTASDSVMPTTSGTGMVWGPRDRW